MDLQEGPSIHIRETALSPTCPPTFSCAAPSAVGDNEPWIYKKGPAFGMPGVHVDGMDVMKVGLVWLWTGLLETGLDLLFQ